jgi:hypothetical protein
VNTWSPTPVRELLVSVSPSTRHATHFSHGFLTQPAEPAKPAGTLTHTREYPYPERGCGYLAGTGPGSSEIPQGYPCCSLLRTTLGEASLSSESERDLLQCFSPTLSVDRIHGTVIPIWAENPNEVHVSVILVLHEFSLSLCGTGRAPVY